MKVRVTKEKVSITESIVVNEGELHVNTCDFLLPQCFEMVGAKNDTKMQKAYLEYLEKEEDFLDDIPDAVITYYLQNYEDIEEWNNIPQKYNKQNITMYSVMELITFKDLYFDEDGRYGWLCGCPWDSAGIAIILSGEEIEVTVQDELI